MFALALLVPDVLIVTIWLAHVRVPYSHWVVTKIDVSFGGEFP